MACLCFGSLPCMGTMLDGWEPKYMVSFNSKPLISRSCSSSSWPKVHSWNRPFCMSW